MNAIQKFKAIREVGVEVVGAAQVELMKVETKLQKGFDKLRPSYFRKEGRGLGHKGKELQTYVDRKLTEQDAAFGIFTATCVAEVGTRGLKPVGIRMSKDGLSAAFKYKAYSTSPAAILAKIAAKRRELDRAEDEANEEIENSKAAIADAKRIDEEKDADVADEADIPPQAPVGVEMPLGEIPDLVAT